MGAIILLYKASHTPENTKHLYNICTTSAQRLQLWAYVVQMLYKCFVFAETILDQFDQLGGDAAIPIELINSMPYLSGIYTMMQYG